MDLLVKWWSKYHIIGDFDNEWKLIDIKKYIKNLEILKLKKI
jgi:hypothetical protein